MGTQRQNFTPDQWSRIWLDGVSLDQVAVRVAAGKVLPWSATLSEYTRDVETVLDLGSGRGELSAVLALNQKKTTLVDWSEENLSFGRSLFQSLGIAGEFCRADITHRLPFRDSSFDAVFSCGVLEFLTDDQISHVLREAWRISARRIIVLVPNAMCLPYRLGKWYMERTGTWSWNGEVPFASLRPYLKQIEGARVKEFSVGARHAFEFVRMPVGRHLSSLMKRLLPPRLDARPALLRQGYLLVTVAEKD